MIYTTGVVSTLEREETLEELQDNKLLIVCTKLGLKPGDRLLDIGCGWGTLTAYAAKNFGCDATGVTLSRNQTQFGNDRIRDNGVSADQARIICTDFRDAPGGPGSYNKIVSLEMAEVRITVVLMRIVLMFPHSTSVFVGIAPSSARSMIFLTTMVSSYSKSLVSVQAGNTRISSGWFSFLQCSFYSDNLIGVFS